jgi:outer membrane protein, multidrug efflux system
VSVILDKYSYFSPLCRPRFFRVLGVSSLLMLVGLSGCTVKPEPITKQEVEQRVQTDLGRLFANQEPVSLRVGLHEAMARAIKYNLKRRIKQLEEAVAVEDLALAKRDLLPKTTASAGYTFRDKEVLTNIKNSELQVVDKDNKQGVANLTWAWSVLDFGVSYVQARQKADQVLIYREQRRKSTQLLIQEVRTRYWQAAMTDMLVPKLDVLLEEAKLARQDLIRMEAAGQEVPSIALENQQILLDTTHNLWEMRKTLVEAKGELSILMNLPPGTLFLLSPQNGEALGDDLVYLPVEALDHYALLNRSEMRGEDYKERISALEARKVLLQMLPNLSFMEGASFFDSNQYLQSQTWSSVGMQITWDLFNLASTPKKLAVAKMEKEVVHSRRLAFSMAAITQLRIALQSYHLSKRDLSIATDINRQQARKVQQGETDKNRMNNTDVKRIEQRANSLLSRINQGMAFAEMQSTLGRIHLTMGVDPMPMTANMDVANIKTTSQIISMRQASVTSAVISGIPQAMLAAHTPRPQSFYPSETDTGALKPGSAAAFWNTLERFSNEIDRQQKWSEELSSGAPKKAPSGYIPPGGAHQPAATMLPPPAFKPQQPLPQEAVQVTLTAD